MSQFDSLFSIFVIRLFPFQKPNTVSIPSSSSTSSNTDAGTYLHIPSSSSSPSNTDAAAYLHVPSSSSSSRRI